MNRWWIGLLGLTLLVAFIVSAWPDRERAALRAGTHSGASTLPKVSEPAVLDSFHRVSHEDKPACGVRGKLTSTSGAVLPGRVCLMAHSDIEDSGTQSCEEVDSAGRFQLMGPKGCEGGVTLLAMAAQHLPGRVSVTAEQVSAHQELLIQLTPGGVQISGRVRDAMGGPVPGAELVLFSEQDLAESRDPTAYAVAGGDGAFVAGVAVGRVRIRASAPGYSSSAIDVTAPAQGVELVLAAASRIVGHVLNRKDQSPLAGVSVQASRVGLMPFPTRSTRSDIDGRFVFTDLAAGAYRLTGDADDWHVAPIETAIGVADEVVVSLFADAAGSVDVQVTRDGSPCTSGTVSIRGPDSRRFRLDPKGRATLSSMPAGQRALIATCSGAKRGTTTVEIAPGARAAVKMNLSSQPFVRGVVQRESGEAISGVTVILRSEETQGWASQCVSDHEGAFECSFPGEGRYTCFASSQGEAIGPTVSLELGRFSQEDVKLTVTSGRGTVSVQVESHEGLPLAGFPAHLKNPKGVVLRGSPVGEGRYLFEHLPLGKYTISTGAELEPSTRASNSVALVNDGQLVSKRLVLAADASLWGKVLDEAGGPLPDTWVSVSSAENLTLSQAKLALSGPAGDFEFSGLPRGTYVLRVDSPWGVAAPAQVSTGEALDIRLRSYGKLSGTLLRADGSPVSQFVVAFSDGIQTAETEFVDEFGRWSLPRVANGQVTVTGSVGPQRVSTTVALRAGGTKVVELRLQDPESAPVAEAELPFSKFGAPPTPPAAISDREFFTQFEGADGD